MALAPRARRVLPLSARAPCSLSRERDPQGGWRLVTPGLEQAFRAAPEWPLARYPWVGMPREPKRFLEPPGCCLRSRLVSSVLEPAPRARGYFPMLRCPRWRESHEPVLPSPLPRLAWNGCLGSPTGDASAWRPVRAPPSDLASWPRRRLSQARPARERVGESAPAIAPDGERALPIPQDPDPRWVG